MIINLNMSINNIFSITHRLIFRYFIHEHLHLLNNSLYIHINIVTLEYLHIHVSPFIMLAYLQFPCILYINTNTWKFILPYIHTYKLLSMATYCIYIYLHICDIGIIVRKFFKEINNLTHFDWNLQASSRPLTYLKHAVPIYCILNTSWK